MTKPTDAFHGFAKEPIPEFHFTSKFIARCLIMHRDSKTVLDINGAIEMAVHPTVTLTESQWLITVSPLFLACKLHES